MAYTIAALVLCIHAVHADVPSVPKNVEVVFDLARLTPDLARQLEGERAVDRIVLDSPKDTHGKYTLYDCKTQNCVDSSV